MLGDSAETTSTESLRYFQFKSYDVLITGIGPMLAAMACSKIKAGDYKEWINLGIAGSLNDEKGLGTIASIGEITHDQLIHSLDNPPDLKPLPGSSRLITVAQPVKDSKRKKLLARKAELVDMEAYPIALTAQTLAQPLKIFKIVSDQAEDDSPTEIVRRIPSLMSRLWDYTSRNVL